MKIDVIYPIDFDGSTKSFNSLMNTILIKASYDNILKKITSYKGMYLSQKRGMCWTIKFENIKGIYGLVLSKVYKLNDSFIGEYSLLYFPSKNDKYLSKSSLYEEYLIYTNNFINKVRDFSAYEELYNNFKIATLNFVIKNRVLKINYTSQTRIKTIALDGVEDKLNILENKYVIEPKGVDKDFPALKFTIPFFNFLNSFFTRLGNKRPKKFDIYKNKAFAVYYEDSKKSTLCEDKGSIHLSLELEYDEIIEESDLKSKLAKNSYLYNFLKNNFWYSNTIDEQKYFSNNLNSLKPKFILITGFLGSGKTNFLQNYIEYETQNNRFVGIIQNEIGKTGLDGKLLDYDYSMVEIDEGCVCCSLAGQLRAGIGTLLEKKTPDTILLETTGVANPFNLLSEIDELSDLIEFDSIVTIVDGKNYKKLSNEYSVFKDQIKAADVILLNKTDLISKEELKEVEESLKINNRCAEIIKTIKCDINPHLVSNYAQLSSSNTKSVSSEFNEEVINFRTHKDDHLSSIKKPVKQKLHKNIFESFLNKLPNNIIRVKGIVEFFEEEGQFVVQFVNHDYELVKLEDNKRKENFLIYIGRKLKEIDINI